MSIATNNNKGKIMNNNSRLGLGFLTSLIIGCASTDETIVTDNLSTGGTTGNEVEISTSEQPLINVGSYDPQHKWGLFYEQGPFHQNGVGTFPFGAYVIWEGNNFALVGAFGSILVDLTQPDAATFPAANPAAPILYEYAEDASCSWAPLRLTCTATEHVFFTPPGVPGFVAPFNWKMSKHPQDNFYVFNSGDPNGNRVDAFNYRVMGTECETAVARIVNFFDAQNVVFTKLELDAEELCN